MEALRKPTACVTSVMKSRMVLGLLAAAIFLWPHFYNGFPICFSDTAPYLQPLIPGKMRGYRSPLYSVFALTLTGRSENLWLLSWAQAVLLGWSLVLTWEKLTRLPRHWSLLAALALSTLTPAGWVIGQAMPDGLAGVAFLLLSMLLFHFRSLSPQERWTSAALFIFCLLTHNSNLPALGLSLVLAAVLLQWNRQRILRAAALLLGTAICFAALQQSVFGRLAAPSSIFPFIVVRMQTQGLLARSLPNFCETQEGSTTSICSDKELILSNPGWKMLWGDIPVQWAFIRAGGWSDARGEFRKVALHGIRSMPLETLSAAAQYTLQLFFMTSPPDDRSYKPAVQMGDVIKASFLGQTEDFKNSRQERNVLFDFYSAFRPIFLIGLIISLAGLGILSRTRTGLRYRQEWAFVVILLLSNAVVCSFISGPYERYQARISWIPALYLVLAAARRAA